MLDDVFVVGVSSYFHSVCGCGDEDAVEDSVFVWVKAVLVGQLCSLGFRCLVVVGDEVSASGLVKGFALECDNVFVVVFELLHVVVLLQLVDGDGARVCESVTAGGP